MPGYRSIPCNWHPPAGWMTVRTVDMHTGGEPFRIVVEGLPSIQGHTVLEKRRYFRTHYDHLRTGLMLEPRGHADMYGAIISTSADADLDVFFMHNEGYSTMCGHGTLALTKFAIETGFVKGPHVSFNAPCGRLEATAEIENGIVIQSTFRNVPSFLYVRDQEISVAGLGSVRFDVAYGGAFYAIVEAATLGLTLDPGDYYRLIDYGQRIKRAVMNALTIEHPFEPELSFLYGAIFTGPANDPTHHSRNVCIFAEGEVDRSPTGSGVSARAALHVAKGDLTLNQPITIESILGTTMTVRGLERTKFGPHDAIIPEVGGSAHFTGRHEFCFDPHDPLNQGFILR